MDIPMRRTFATSRRATSTARNVRVRLILDDGTTGFGEGSPTPYVTGEDQESVLAALESVRGDIAGLDVGRQAVCRAWIDARFRNHPTAGSALEMALLDASARLHAQPLCRSLGGALDQITSDLTLSLGSIEEAGTAAAEAAALGFHSIKVKVGSPDAAEDLARLVRICEAAPGCRLRLDANQAFTVESARYFLASCRERQLPIEMMEQPVPAADLDSLHAVTQFSWTPVIADEAVCSPQDAMEIARRQAAHGINIKIAKLGFFGALDVIAIARAAGLRLMLGCMLESTLGIGAAVHFACGTGAFEFLDLDSHLLIGQEAEGVPFSQSGDVQTPQDSLAGLGWTGWTT